MSSSRMNLSDYPIFGYKQNDIERVGKIISSDNIISENGTITPEVENAFLIANSWRDSHAYPMRSIHSSIRHHLRANKIEAITAARLKRMQAIRRKLRRIGLGLDQLQDLGGCRAILPSIADARLLIELLKEKIPSEVQKENDYISSPKKDGYRSHHLILRFARPQKTSYDGKRIEVQIRTQLQHSWATAIEAVGLFRGEELKNNQGDADWLRLFMLMSAEFAETEGCVVAAGTPDTKRRRKEIKELQASLDAVKMLESISNGVRGTDFELEPGYKPSHYLIKYAYKDKKVFVEPYNKAINATNSYDKAEETLRGEKDKDVVVLIEVDKIDNLRKAYPNYFGDVELFKTQLKRVALGDSAIEFSATPKQPPARKLPDVVIDPSWMRGTRFAKPSLKAKKKGKR